jgi:multidrug transporter EmrE-like cation transporter
MYLGTKKIAMLWTGIVSLLISLGTVYLQSTLSFLEAGGYDILMDLPEIFENIWIDRNIHLAALMGVFSFVFYTISSYFYQIALQKIPASKCVPIIQTFDNFFTITVGILIFGQLIGNWFFYIIALVISVLGAFVLGKYQMK